ncbi:MAG TPA: anthranilate phosphoribosyltransferase [Terriglobales bacterium]|nr:anthranilate phosphoribosyltransferase [Terriglobales bacterium]
MAVDIRSLLSKLIRRESLTAEEAESAFAAIMAGEVAASQIAGLLVGLACKGETIDEITGGARAMRRHGVPLAIASTDGVDTCGTGGDGQSTFNVSTAAALIASAAGATVVKHGNRAMSGVVGAADVLEELGVRIDLTPDQVARCIAQVGLGFAFAPTFHPAMRHAAGARRELGVRTIFNLLGPLSNPAGVRRQVIGVFAPTWVEPLAEAARRLGSTHVLVVHSDDGLDEISIAAETMVAELRDGAIEVYRIVPKALGVEAGAITDLQVDSRPAAAATLRAVLEGQPGPALEIAVANAAAAIYVAGGCGDLREGVVRAREVIASGAALQQLSRLAEVSRQ